ncbi:hypothetical protein Y695_00038 [Hydrogenophaga sp. T4]|nr:hypothetical protein Y695_00038 [Hydrogenophaga sp. T4]
MRPHDPYQYLPQYAKCALEFLDSQADRSITKLDAYLNHYAKAMGQLVDEHARFSAHAIAVRRFAPDTMDATGSLPIGSKGAAATVPLRDRAKKRKRLHHEP